MNEKVRKNTSLELLKIGVVSNILECYEFSIYTFLAPIIGQVLLQAKEPMAQLIQSYILFTITYFARPFGSLLFGHIADKVGRSSSLKMSLILMSVPAALIGLLPTYDQIGSWATIGFLFLRFIQGFSIGGELAINACYIYESAPDKHRSWLCSTVNVSSTIGILMGSCTAAVLFWGFNQSSIIGWAWRLPYLLGIPITIWIALIRKAIHEPHPIVVKEKLQTESSSLVMKLPPFSKLLPVIILGGFMQVCSYILFLWMPTYLIYFLKIQPSIAQTYNTFGLLIWISLMLFMGYLSGIFGYRRIVIIHILAIMIMVLPIYIIMQSISPTQLLWIYLLLAWLQSGIPAVMMEILGDSFPQSVRGMGMSLGATLPATFLGGTVPLICTYMIHKTNLLIFPAIYIIIFGLIALPVAFQLPFGKTIREV